MEHERYSRFEAEQAVIRKIFLSATEEHPILRDADPKRLEAVIRGELERIREFEEAAQNDRENGFDVDPEIAERIGTIWVFSGPGTYDSPSKEDRYRDFPWAHGMDRARLSRAALLARRIAEVRGGRPISRGSLADLPEQKEKTKALIAEYGPRVVYNGTTIENAVARDVLGREGIIIPAENVSVIGDGIERTADQVKTFLLPDDSAAGEKGIALVSHAPHLDRILHMLARYPVLPAGSVPRLFPLATPEAGREEYAEMEIRGLLYYLYVAHDKDAVEEVHPYALANEK